MKSDASIILKQIITLFLDLAFCSHLVFILLGWQQSIFMSNTRSNSQLRSRARGGRYGVSPNKQKVAEPSWAVEIPASEREAYEREGDDWFDKPRRRRDPSKERPTHLRGFSLSSVFLTRDSQTKDPKDMGETISRVYSDALVCSRIISALQITTKFILGLILFFVFKRVIQGDITLLTKALRSCFADKEISCYSKIRETFFPFDTIFQHHWVSFRLADSGLVSSRFKEITFPLLFDNLAVLFIAAIAIVIVYWLLGKIYRLLIDIAYTANSATSQRHLREKQS